LTLATFLVGLPTSAGTATTHCQVFSLADIVHFGLPSPPCTFPGIQITQHSAFLFFFALSSTAGYLPSGLSQPSRPAAISAIFRWIRFIYCRRDDCRLT